MEIFAIALIRGHLCQTLGAGDRLFEPNELYTVGLLSALGALLDRPMQPVANAIKLARVALGNWRAAV